MTRARASYWGSAVIFGFREAPTRCFEERLDPSPAVSIFADGDSRPDRSSAAFVFWQGGAQRQRDHTKTSLGTDGDDHFTGAFEAAFALELAQRLFDLLPSGVLLFPIEARKHLVECAERFFLETHTLCSGR